jgi:hypothetical protein
MRNAAPSESSVCPRRRKRYRAPSRWDVQLVIEWVASGVVCRIVSTLTPSTEYGGKLPRRVRARAQPSRSRPTSHTRHLAALDS